MCGSQLERCVFSHTQHTGLGWDLGHMDRICYLPPASPTHAVLHCCVGIPIHSLHLQSINVAFSWTFSHVWWLWNEICNLSYNLPHLAWSCSKFYKSLKLLSYTTNSYNVSLCRLRSFETFQAQYEHSCVGLCFNFVLFCLFFFIVPSSFYNRVIIFQATAIKDIKRLCHG